MACEVKPRSFHGNGLLDPSNRHPRTRWTSAGQSAKESLGKPVPNMALRCVRSARRVHPDMWKKVRLIVCLVFFVPAFALLGASASLDGGERSAWAGLAEFN